MSDSATRGAASAARLEAAAGALLAEVSRLPEPVIAWKPAEDVWSVIEILGHLAEFVPFWTAQALQITRHPEQEWGRTHADLDRLEAVKRAPSRTLADLTQDIQTSVAASAATLRGLSEQAFGTEAPSRNPRWGRKPASFVVDDLLVGHLEKHLCQIQRNATQFTEAGISSSTDRSPVKTAP